MGTVKSLEEGEQPSRPLNVIIMIMIIVVIYNVLRQSRHSDDDFLFEV